MNRLSQQDIARIYGMYIGQQVEVLHYGQGELVGVNNLQAVAMWTNGSNINQTAFNFCHLKLFDLSDITDEHAIEEGRMCGLYGEILIDRSKPHGIVIKCSTGRNLTIWYPIAASCISNPRLFDKDGVEVIEYNCDIFDKLREINYMLPYKGVNLFDAGIAIRKNITNDK